MSTVLDDTLLENASVLTELDSAGLLRSAATAGAQVRSAAQAAREAGVDRLSGSRPRALVLLRRPGSSRYAVPLFAALLGSACPVPVVVADAAPTWLGPLDVLVAHTADPDDRDLADSVGRAVRRGCEVVLSSPREGPIVAAGAGAARVLEPRVPVPPGLDFPRALATLLIAGSALGLLSVDLDELAAELDRESERDHPSHESFVNPAKSLALRLADHTPLLWGVDAVATELAGYASATLAGHAAMVAHSADVAEAAAAVGLQRALANPGEGGIFHDPFDDPINPGAGSGSLAAPPRVVLLATEDGDPEAASIRRAGRTWDTADTLHPVEEIPLGSRNASLRRAAVLATRFDLAALYLGLATAVLGSDRGADPDGAWQLSGPA
ncbi:MAG TPA: SIS domain-containing protein [Pseudonocardia sp.]